MNSVVQPSYFTGARGQFRLGASAETGTTRPIVWSIAGSDSGGGAGVQADIKAFAAFGGVHGCTAVAAITAQNSVAVTRVDAVSAELLDAQLAVLAQDMPPQAIKTGLLGSVENLRVVCRWVDRLRSQGLKVALVVDPVLGASTGAAFADDALVQAYVNELLPRATLVTPNRVEAARLGLVVGQARDTFAVVITGGDAAQHDGVARDWFHSPQASGWLSLPRVDTTHHHGTGCTFASTAAAALASGYCVADAVVLAKMATTHALHHAYAAGAGAGPVNAQADFAQHAINLPALSLVASAAQAAAPAGMAVEPPAAFRPLRDPALGVYAVVDSATWVRRVLAAGIRTVQLRIKDPHEPTLEAQIRDAIAAANATPGAQLFINDHWALALRLGAYGVHLGQEDLDTVYLAALRDAGVRLGLSTHSYWEVARAWALRPSYIACGPIFATQSKDMPWIPQGLDNLRYWAGLLPVPVVGIAGIDVRNIAEMAAQGVASAAVITAITQAADPELACRQLMVEFARGQGLLRGGVPTRARPTL
ncbi:bifunctional hydroxymethylpyrimidine kinase/phosphomethylpyrimidine kinase [Rhodoferax sp. AJA081-3]|uniref:bifunctional hydroxymethylpyrimidine kinase/phosphomethylpyrimidine kinase n=1 Tax=Rhodoferax sp. AJA081-3 TaxID=2752316 RepID=UPI001ADF7107|nr:bifunctional hydroxymethylpyrimidine kinase/phosphomethylpyrimidine kinase [Rhodoferax sp. AJA081-3]QTN30199.1 bifunctional hydroxymethylpyrimidine kinase/phosphomethylpyrimidine kinase [Rhodoferax sp. AJA081-3]